MEHLFDGPDDPDQDQGPSFYTPAMRYH